MLEGASDSIQLGSPRFERKHTKLDEIYELDELDGWRHIPAQEV